jgi:predicted GH43/DUF377 family glycosyl hydrolase
MKQEDRRQESGVRILPPGLLVAVGLVALVGCGRYGDFTLPAPEAGGPRPPFHWEPQAGPVLDRGAAGQWDSVDVLNPSVVRLGPAYVNFYSGFDGHKWSTGMAASIDGIAWRKPGRALTPEGWEGNYSAANGTALVENGEVLYWYQAGDPVRIAFARSRDGREWHKHPEPVLDLGPRGSFDERGVADPFVLRAGGRFYMFYLGADRAARQRLGVARSSDGVRWEKLRSNPVLQLGERGAFDEVGLGEPAVWSSAGFYWMLYTGRDRGERRRIGLARSADGANWERVPGFAPLAGDQAWNREVLCDPAVEVTPEGIRVWFGGGDVAHPVENIHGSIGVGLLRGVERP